MSVCLRQMLTLMCVCVHLKWKEWTMKSVNATKHTCSNTYTHALIVTLAFRFSFCFTFSFDLLKHIKWSARAVASVNRDLDLVKESIRLQQHADTHARALNSFIHNHFIEIIFTIREHCYCYCCHLNSSLIFNTHTLFSSKVNFFCIAQFRYFSKYLRIAHTHVHV